MIHNYHTVRGILCCYMWCTSPAKSRTLQVQANVEASSKSSCQCADFLGEAAARTRVSQTTGRNDDLRHELLCDCRTFWCRFAGFPYACQSAQLPAKRPVKQSRRQGPRHASKPRKVEWQQTSKPSASQANQANKHSPSINQSNKFLPPSPPTRLSRSIFRNMAPYSAIDDVPDLTGKVFIVTGANSGVGYESTRAFLRKGAEVVMACRNPKRVARAMKRLMADKTLPKGAADNVVFIQLDLGDLKSVKEFASEFSSSFDRLDCLLNNAGLWLGEKARTADDFDQVMGVNHVSEHCLQLSGRDLWLVLVYYILNMITRQGTDFTVNIQTNRHVIC
jgi:hypothetical protein